MNSDELRRAQRAMPEVAAEPSPHRIWDRLPDRTFPDVFDVVENILQHAVRLGPEGRPIGRVERPALVRRRMRSWFIG